MSDVVLGSGTNRIGNGLKWALVAAINLLLLYGVTLMYAQGEMAFALLVLIITATANWVFLSSKAYSYRYVFPALVGVLVFVVFPLIYTVNIAFTNYSSTNLLSLQRVKEIHLAKTYETGGGSYGFSLYQNGESYQLNLQGKGDNKHSYTTEDFYLMGAEGLDAIQVTTLDDYSQPVGDKLAIKELIKLRQGLKKVQITLPDGTGLAMTGLRSFGAIAPVYLAGDNDTLIDSRSSAVLTPDHATGFYIDERGERLSPGFTVYTGWDNFIRVTTDEGVQEPFLKIFVWTVSFSALTVVFTLAVGLLMACLMQWEPLKGNGVYRLFLILPYAVPAFISILIFRGLFNQNFGEINMVLNALFGLRPEWFSDEGLARSMLLIVNTWLGYPYMMILCMGLLKAIPDDLYEASAIDGAGPVDNLMHITLPMIIKPLTPLLIASFAFNFNNFVLVELLTGGGPDMIGATTPAGSTDLLVSYTYRIAFGQYGQDFGLASAIATIIFLMVGVISWLNLRATKKLQES